MSKNRFDIFPVLFVLLATVAVFSRLWHLGAAPFGADYMEFYKLALRHQSIIEFWKNPPWMNQIPLNETLSLLLVKVGLPATPFVVRLPFAVMGLLGLFAAWRFVHSRFGVGAALSVLCLAVFNPFYLYFSRTAYHYAGAACWSAILFWMFWTLWEDFLSGKAPAGKKIILWFLIATIACHMHMAVWVVVGLQGGGLFGCAWVGLREFPQERRTSILQLILGTLSLLVIMSRWIYRALTEVLKVVKGEGHHIGGDASDEFLRLLPAYFSGETVVGQLLLLLFIGLSVTALFCTKEHRREYRRLFLLGALHIIVLLVYVSFVGGGVAKITYFSPVWPHFVILLGVGAFLGIQAISRKQWFVGLIGLCLGGYVVMTIRTDWAIINLDGKPTPYYKVNAWVLENLPVGTPILTDRWLEPWNELAVHNPGGINYTFTVPDEPVDNYKRFSWRSSAEQFFHKYPQAAFLELGHGKYADELGDWEFPQSHFSQYAAITNDAAMVLRRFKVYPTKNYASANTNRIVTRIYYNTAKDLIEAARREGRETLRLYGEGWGYAKPGWQQGHFEDFRTVGKSAELEIYNLTDSSLAGTLEIMAAAAGQPKTVSVGEEKTVFSVGRIRSWKCGFVLNPGLNRLQLSSPSANALFVLDTRWIPEK